MAEEMVRAVALTVRDSGDLRELLAALANEFAYQILERLDDDRFEAFDPELDPAPWPEGTCFGARLQVRWRRVDTDYRVLLVGELPPADWGALPTAYVVGREDLARCDRKDQAFYLWGELREGQAGYREARVPREFAYPVAGNRTGRAKLHVREYVDPQTAAVQFYRWLRVEGE